MGDLVIPLEIISLLKLIIELLLDENRGGATFTDVSFIKGSNVVACGVPLINAIAAVGLYGFGNPAR